MSWIPLKGPRFQYQSKCCNKIPTKTARQKYIFIDQLTRHAMVWKVKQKGVFSLHEEMNMKKREFLYVQSKQQSRQILEARASHETSRTRGSTKASSTSESTSSAWGWTAHLRWCSSGHTTTWGHHLR